MSRKINENALSIVIDTEALQKIQDRINENGDIIDDMVDKIVEENCKALDDYMQFIRRILEDKQNPPTDLELDDFILNLPVLLYFSGSAQEKLGVKEDMAKAIRQELYNDIYNNVAGTIADKTAQSELATQNEYIAHIIYQRAYKKIKYRMELGLETLQSIKKVITRRGQEYELTRIK